MFRCCYTTKPKPLLESQQFLIPSDALLEKTKWLATEQFIYGHYNQSQFASVSTKDEIQRFVREQGKRKAFTQFKDTTFPFYNANVTGNYAAGAGPKTNEEVGALLYSLSEAKIHYVIAFGNRLSSSEENKFQYDFLDYFIIPPNETRKYTHQTSPGTPPDEIYVMCLEMRGKPFKTNNGLCSNEKGLRYAADNEPVQVTLEIEHHLNDSESKGEVRKFQLKVTYHPLIDNLYIDLSRRKPEEIELFLEHYAHGLVNPVFVHCASGVGRTGFGIGMFEIFRHFNQIFQHDTHIKTTEEILKLVNQIRERRPGLIWNEDQLEYAINNAVVLANYCNQKKLDFAHYGYRQALQLTRVPDWVQYLPIMDRIARPKPLYTDNEADALERIKPGLIQTLRDYDEFLVDELAANRCCNNSKKLQHALDAVRYLKNILEIKQLPDTDLNKKYENVLNSDELGEEIRVYTSLEIRYIGSVKNLLKIAYDVGVAANKPRLERKEDEAPPRLQMF